MLGEEITELLGKAEPIETGVIYKHYKGDLYEVLMIANDSETLEEVVVYKNLHSKKVYVRPAKMWSEIVTGLDNKYTFRFTKFVANCSKA